MSTPEPPTPVTPPPPQQQPRVTPPPHMPVSNTHIPTPQQLSREEINRLQYEAFLQAKSKRKSGGRMAMGIAGIAVAFFIFPLAFTVWKTGQGEDSKFRNKTTALPGTHSMPLSDYEREYGQFSHAVLNPEKTMAASLERQQREVFRKHPSGISPDEQHQLYLEHTAALRGPAPASAQAQLDEYKRMKREKQALQQQQQDQ